MLGKPRLDQPPASGEIRVAGRQRSDAMKVIRQNNRRIEREWPSLPNRAKCRPQRSNVLLVGK